MSYPNDNRVSQQSNVKFSYNPTTPQQKREATIELRSENVHERSSVAQQNFIRGRTSHENTPTRT